MNEILPGLLHWTAVHPEIGIEVSSHWLRDAGVVLDPLLPPGGLDAFAAAPPQHVVLTNRLHGRHSEQLARALGCTVWCHERGLHHFAPERGVRGFLPGVTLPGGIETLEVDVLCPDETALRLPIAEGVLAFADGVIREGEGPLAFVPDDLLGDDPGAVKRGLRAAYARLLPLAFDHLVFAHGRPWIGGGKQALRRFLAA